MTTNASFVTITDVFDLVQEWNKEANALLTQGTQLPTTAAWHAEQQHRQEEEEKRRVANEAERLQRVTPGSANSTGTGGNNGVRRRGNSGMSSSGIIEFEPRRRANSNSVIVSGLNDSQRSSSRDLTSSLPPSAVGAAATAGPSPPPAVALIIAPNPLYATEADARRSAGVEASHAYEVLAAEKMKFFTDRLAAQKKQVEAVGLVASQQKATRGY